MKNDTERGQLGAWARKERLALGMSVEQVVARLSAIGGAVDPAYLRAIESGSKRPRLDSDIVDALAAVYKSRPAEPAPAPTGDLATLVALVTAQQTQIAALTKAVEQLTTAISTDRQGPPWVDDFAPALAGYIVSGLQAPRRRASEQ